MRAVCSMRGHGGRISPARGRGDPPARNISIRKAMNLSSLLLSILLHGAFFVSCAVVAWLCFRGQSAARIVAGGRMIMAATLLLAVGETAIVTWPVRTASLGSAGEGGELPLPW